MCDACVRRSGWEPVPWDATEPEAEMQRAGCAARLEWRIRWRALPWADFPEGGLYAQDRDWFRDREVVCHARRSGEDLLLVQHIWHGWPDPPEFGLVSRALGGGADWRHWGHFHELPEVWKVPAGIL